VLHHRCLLFKKKVMATVILCPMGVWDMDTVMETTATVMSPNMDMIMGIHMEDMAIRMTIPTAMVRPQVISLSYNASDMLFGVLIHTS